MFASSSAALSSQSVLTQNNPEISDYFSLFSVYFAEVTQGPFKDQLIKLKHTERTHKTVPLQHKNVAVVKDLCRWIKGEEGKPNFCDVSTERDLQGFVI